MTPTLHTKGHTGGLLVLAALLVVVFYILFSIGYSGETTPIPRGLPVTTGFNYSIYGVKDFVQLCLNHSLQQSLTTFGRQASVINQPDLLLPTAKTVLLIEEDKQTVRFPPSPDTTLTNLVNASMQQCIANFALFTAKDIKVHSGGADTTVKVSADSLDVYYQHPLVVSSAGQQATYQRFSLTLPLRIPAMLTQAEEIITFAKQRPEDADLTALSSTPFEVMFFAMDNATIVVFRDMENYVKGAPYEFWFGMR